MRHRRNGPAAEAAASAATLQHAFQAIDADASGAVDLGEMLRTFKSLKGQGEAALALQLEGRFKAESARAARAGAPPPPPLAPPPPPG